MATIKENILSMVKKLPDSATIEDIMERLYVEQKILKGQNQFKQGRFYSHEEAKELMNKWLK